MSLLPLFFLFLLTIFGCTLSPKYTRPDTFGVTKWKEEPPPLSDLNTPPWWETLGDPHLTKLITQALQGNQDLKAAVMRVQQFAAQLKITRSQLFPQISAEGKGARQKISPNLLALGTFTSPIFNEYELGLNVSYLLDIWGQIRSASDAALASLLSEIQVKNSVILTVISSVASSYIQLIQYDQQILIAQETLKTREESYALAKTRFELGLTSQMQVEQALSEVEEAQTTLDQLQISEQLEENLLSVLLGIPPTHIERSKSFSDLTLPSSALLCVPSELINQRPDILAAEQKLIAANAQIGVARAMFFPQISLLGSYGVASSVWSTLFNAQSSMWEYGATILQEIFTGGKLTGNLQLANAQKFELIHTYQSTVLTAFKEVNDALISHKLSLEIAKVQKEEVETMKSYFHLATLQYDEGETDYLTYLDAERKLFSAELSCVAAQAASFTTLIQIYQAVGGSWVDKAALDVAKSISLK